MTGVPNVRLRRRIELAIRLAAPALDLTLAALGGASRLLTRGQAPAVGSGMVHAERPARRGLRPQA
jgi:hypothetical protein